MSHRNSILHGRPVWIIAGLVTAVAVVVFWLTAFRTLTWWDNSSYSAAAISLGIGQPPGSLLATLVGWLAIKLSPLNSDLFSLNLLAGLLAALTAALTGVIAIRLQGVAATAFTSSSILFNSKLALAAAGITALGFAFGATLWSYALRFTPYVFTALFTALILWSIVRWWQESDRGDAIGWLVIIAVLFGLDFSVHRTNLLLLPGFLIWVLLKRPGGFRCGRCWLYGTGAFIAGLAFHLLLIPMAASHPAINMGDPSNWSRFWSYVTLQQFGGGFLIDIFPRKGPFFSSQVMGYLDVFASNFFTVSGKLGVLGTLPTILGVIGITAMWRKNVRLAVGLLVLFLLSSLGAIIYFNVPAGFFRSMDRHYLPSLVIFSIFMTGGAMTLAGSVRNLVSGYRTPASIAAMLLIISVPLGQFRNNYHKLDESKNDFAEIFAENVFAGLPPNSIILTGGDNDTFPLWCLQIAKKTRTDVSVVNVGLLNTEWYAKQVAHGDPGIPINLSDEEIAQLRVRPWTDTTVFIPLSTSLHEMGLDDSISLPDTLGIQVAPTIADKYIMAQDLLLIKMLQQNRWRRPVYVMSTLYSNMVPWLRPYLRAEGYASRVVPVASPPLNLAVLKENLLEKYSYAGFADASLPIDPVSRQLAWNLYSVFLQAASWMAITGNRQECANLISQMQVRLPVERLQPPQQIEQGIAAVCGGQNFEGN